MANEMQISFSAGKTVYAQVRSRIGQIWNTGTVAFESYLTANIANYSISLTEQGSASGFYAGNFPSAIAAGVYSILAKQRLGGSVAETDPTVGAGDLQWNGTATLPLSDVATSGQLGQIGPIPVYRGQMVRNYPFFLLSSADHVTPLLSGTCSGQVSRDGGSWGALQSGAFTEVGLGMYTVQALTSGDTLANTLGLLFNGVNVSGGASDPCRFTLILNRTSGQ